MATGGWHKAFWPNTGMRDLAGEGIAMAHRAGAQIGNMEFITFCCNVLLSPPVWRGSIATYVMSLLCGGQLKNSAGEDFLTKYDPFAVQKGTRMEWNKSFVPFATMKEVREGKGFPNGGVYYGIGQVPGETIERLAMVVFPQWKYKATDLSELGRMLKENKPVEVGPVVEYFDGGIVVNERFGTAVEGLYSAGGCTLGPFGANRVFSAITEMLVHGADTGQNAGKYARQVKASPPNPQAFRQLQEEAESPLPEDYPYTDNDNWLQEIIAKFEEGIMKIFRRPATITTLTPPQGCVPFLEMMKKMTEARSDIGGHH